MLSELSSLLFIKNYISVQNLLNNMKIIENQYKNMFYYHFYFNKNKQIMISVITSKSFTFIETIYINHIFSASIIFTFTFSVSFTYSNQKFNSVANKLKN